MYDGAPTVATHEHYNADGELVGTTRVITESPWDDDARAEAEALYEAEFLICSHCGNLREDCSDPTKANAWYPQRDICYASRAQAAADRKYGDKHDKAPYFNGTDGAWSEKPSAKAPFHFRDGVRVWVSPHNLTPDDKFI